MTDDEKETYLSSANVSRQSSTEVAQEAFEEENRSLVANLNYCTTPTSLLGCGTSRDAGCQTDGQTAGAAFVIEHYQLICQKFIAREMDNGLKLREEQHGLMNSNEFSKDKQRSNNVVSNRLSIMSEISLDDNVDFFEDF